MAFAGLSAGIALAAPRGATAPAVLQQQAVAEAGPDNGVAGAPTGAVDASTRQLAGDLEQVLRESGWPSDRWSVMVVSLDGGDTLFAHQPGADVSPASNLKLFTTAAALHYLGPEYRYTTYVAGSGPLRNGTLEGDLVVYGTGDPTVSGRFYEEEEPVWDLLADSLAELGIQRITGDVLGDASYFEGAAVGTGWQTTYITHTYAAPASALSFNDNVVTLRVTPGESVGAPASVQILPGGTVRIRNEARTVGSGRTHIEVERASYDAPLVLTGQIQQGASAVWRAVPAPDPALFAASAFAEALTRRGIQVTGSARSIYEADGSPVTSREVFAPRLQEGRPVVQTLAAYRSPPLLEILKVINQRSHNLYAESVLRTVGRVATGHGSVQGGERAVAALLEDASPAAATVRMDDGSGLSISNRASARSFIELLAFMQQSPHYETYLETLPEAAVDRGLRRMQKTAAAGNLRAKTGTIDRVSSLSGYVHAANGETLAFSIISNDVPSTWRAKRIEDRIGARLASFDRPRPTGRLAAAPAGPDSAGPPDTVAPSVQVAEAPASEVSDPGQAEATGESPETYVVKRGDTLDGIARRNGISLSALEAANPGLNPRRLMPGQELTIPGG